jgi:hypothetical protein
MFENEGPARRIFDNWRKDLGTRDEESLIRLSLITGTDRKHPSSYTALLSTNIDIALKNRKPTDQVIVASRRQQMHNPNPGNLSVFLEAYREYGCYFLVPCIPKTSPPNAPMPRFITECRILKRDLVVRPEWEIGRHDHDYMALSPDDDPIIPEGKTDAPIIEALEFRRRHDKD